MGVADQRVARIRNRFRRRLGSTDVASVSTKDLPQDLSFFASSINRLFLS